MKGTPQTFCPVPFGEIFAVLGSNVEESAYSTLLQGTNIFVPGIVLEDGKYCRFTEDGQYKLPASDFRTHSRFLILALSLLVEYDTLHIEVKSYPSDEFSASRDSSVPYDRRVRWFTELILRYDTDLSDCTFCFKLHADFSKSAWERTCKYFALPDRLSRSFST